MLRTLLADSGGPSTWHAGCKSTEGTNPPPHGTALASPPSRPDAVTTKAGRASPQARPAVVLGAEKFAHSGLSADESRPAEIGLMPGTQLWVTMGFMSRPQGQSGLCAQEVSLC